MSPSRQGPVNGVTVVGKPQGFRGRQIWGHQRGVSPQQNNQYVVTTSKRFEPLGDYREDTQQYVSHPFLGNWRGGGAGVAEISPT